MQTILTVIKKEITDTLRDKRTLISAIVMPALIIPLLMFGMTQLTKTIMEKEQSKKLKIGLIDAPDVIKTKLDKEEYKLITITNLDQGREAILSDSLDGLISFDDEFLTDIDNMKSGKVNMFYKSTNLAVKSRLSDELEAYNDELMADRIVEMNISKEALKPVNVLKYDIAPPKEQFGKLAGGFLPYIFLIFCFMGCMYPALDLVTGEKERGTIETLLTVPASRFKILMGKMITIALVGLAAASMTIAGMIFGIKFMPDMPEEFMSSLTELISPKFIIMLFAMLVPLSLFFSGILSAVVVRAKSFKEAQSYVTPMSFLIILPAAIALMPGIELNWVTVFIPILNLALATKEIIAGTIQMEMYAIIVVSLVVLAIGAVMFSHNQFSKESMVLK